MTKECKILSMFGILSLLHNALNFDCFSISNGKYDFKEGLYSFAVTLTLKVSLHGSHWLNQCR